MVQSPAVHLVVVQEPLTHAVLVLTSLPLIVTSLGRAFDPEPSESELPPDGGWRADPPVDRQQTSGYVAVGVVTEDAPRVFGKTSTTTASPAAARARGRCPAFKLPTPVLPAPPAPGLLSLAGAFAWPAGSVALRSGSSTAPRPISNPRATNAASKRLARDIWSWASARIPKQTVTDGLPRNKARLGPPCHRRGVQSAIRRGRDVSSRLIRHDETVAPSLDRSYTIEADCSSFGARIL